MKKLLSIITGLAGFFLLYNITNADIRGFVHDSYDGVSGKNIPMKITIPEAILLLGFSISKVWQLAQQIISSLFL